MNQQKSNPVFSVEIQDTDGTCVLEVAFGGERSLINVAVSGSPSSKDVEEIMKNFLLYLVENPVLITDFLDCFPAAREEVSDYFVFMNELEKLGNA
jgi:hypothetical protein